MIDEAAIKRQIEIEEDFLNRGFGRGVRELNRLVSKGDLLSSPKMAKLIRVAHTSVASSIDELKVGSARSKYRSKLKDVSTDVLATLSLIVILKHIVKSEYVSLNAILISLGKAVFAETMYNMGQKVAPAYMSKVSLYLSERNTSSPNHIFRTYKAALANIKLNQPDWTANEYVGIGKLLLAPVLDTGLIVLDRPDQRSMWLLKPSVQMLEIIEHIKSNPTPLVILPPMVVPPIPHTDAYDGGYITDNGSRPTYMNKNLPNRLLKEVSDKLKDAPEILSALNKLQAVPYCVNTRTLDILNKALAMGITVGIPRLEPYTKPIPFELGNNPTERQLEDFESWKAEMRNWYSMEKQRVKAIQSFRAATGIAREFRNEPTLYFPTYVDWRYRIYFQGAFNPQGSDLGKSLLMFANGEPLGDRGLFWLKVHAATCFGYDKTLFEDRAKWVDENYALIERMVLEQDVDADIFRQAAEPWCFIAACNELVSAIQSGDPTKYISHIPVSMDATNSGAQHFSALLKDPIGGRYTNLVWMGNTEKADLYMATKDLVDARLRKSITAKETMVQSDYWTTNEVTRSMLKRPVMTYFYSAKDRSCTEYVMSGALENGYKSIEGYTLLSLCAFLSKHIRCSIEEAMPLAAAAMRYLQQLVIKEDYIKYTTPVGGVVYNYYPSTIVNRVEIRAFNVRHIILYDVNYNKLDVGKMRAGIAPNFIHSMDAAHLTKVVNTFDNYILPIHDSIGTYACYIDELHKTIREEFIKLYKDKDYLNDLKHDLIAQGYAVPDVQVPSMGTLDIESVRHSPFFFN